MYLKFQSDQSSLLINKQLIASSLIYLKPNLRFLLDIQMKEKGLC